MIEILLVYLLVRDVRLVAGRKGQPVRHYQLQALGIALAGYLLGFVIGARFIHTSGGFLLMYVGAGVGALIAHAYVSRLPSISVEANWERTHTVGPRGAAGWAAPSTARPPLASLAPGIDVMVVGTDGPLAEVRAASGWSGWVEKERLVARPDLGTGWLTVGPRARFDGFRPDGTLARDPRPAGPEGSAAADDMTADPTWSEELTATGGAPATAGAPATGGAPATERAPATGGAPATERAPATGGAPAAVDGTPPAPDAILSPEVPPKRRPGPRRHSRSRSL